MSQPGECRIATLRHIALIVAALALTGAAALPEAGPIPLPRPEEKPAADPAQIVTKPAEKTDEKSAEPAPAPAVADRPAESAADFEACSKALTDMGARYEKAEALEDGKACGIERPVALSALPGGIAVEPPVTIRCEAALQLARWMEGTVKPALTVAMPGETVASVQQASGYVCRNRNNAETGRISEHAFGNAVDIAGLTLESGKTIDIHPADRDSTLGGAFQRAITEAACLYFTTVLDPGSDAAHETHLHLDVKARRGGYRYCW